MKNLDPQTLESLAEMICVEGPGFKTPGPYRSMGEICRFFQNAEIAPQGMSGTRKWFTKESLDAVNGTDSLERVILRLASPHEYRNDTEILSTVMDKLNQVLMIEGLGVEIEGVTPKIVQKRSSLAPKKPGGHVDQPPDFKAKIDDGGLAHILTFRWNEAQRCVHGGAYLAAIVMMGSILEGALMHKATENPSVANCAKSAPRDGKTNEPKQIGSWGLSALIDVAHEVGWIKGDRKRFSAALRDSRNIVHPYQQRRLGEFPDKKTCDICWQVVRAAISDLFEEREE